MPSHCSDYCFPQPDTVIASTTKVGERSQIKKSIIGRHCVIGKNVRLTGCIVWDFVNIADGAKLENVILCNQVRIGSKAQMKDCEVGQGFQCPPDSEYRGAGEANDDCADRDGLVRRQLERGEAGCWTGCILI